jgi:dolichol-phosphate mannosyltransferase
MNNETGLNHTENRHAVEHRCLVIIPTYNEADNIERLLDAILAQGPQFDVLVVDDNSPDGTAGLVARLRERTARIHLLKRRGKLGLGSAYRAGFNYGLQQGYPYLCEMDGDFSHQPHYLPILLAVVQREADVALGSRNVPGGRVENWPLLRRLISKCGSLYARTLLNLPVHDATGGFKCFRAEVLRALDLNSICSNGYAFQVEMNYRCHQAGFCMREFPITFPDRIAGQSKMSRQIVLEAARVVLELRFGSLRVPRRVSAEISGEASQ